MQGHDISIRTLLASSRCGRHQRGRTSGLAVVIAIAAVALTILYVGSDLSFEHSLHEPVAGASSAPAPNAAPTGTAPKA